ncbi:chemotaxis-specific methylesterase [Haloterrigena salina JCM 13891]|uniref:Protein-glutamate methylesterase/protein-glutamine glutaminase n=1 Tax=Haloterrigena salina JCM 13891 TaxID=1227488 RepID=M0C4M7_9EURY|nr:chemotaxis-specific protein-glutamate methyltransferase CheB [Haloterrigena salina]ELZ16884.1 chemotaxis-specific methylesterase [Haloterrigena salina JCM 13891]
MVRAVIADDSGVMREILSEILTAAGIDVVEAVEDGTSAVRAILERDPDVATIDISMPDKNGLEVIEEVMAERPTPMLVISARANDGASETFEALDRGAVDFIAKPSGQLSVDIWSQRDEIVEKVRAAAAVDPTTLTQDAGAEPVQSTVPADRVPDGSTVVIGSSTGGPQVLERVLAELPREAKLRILIVQHMTDHYTGRFAMRLNERTAYECREASDGDTVGAGDAVVAKGGRHLEVTADRDGELAVAHDDGPKIHNVKPAIDVTMRSAAEAVSGPLVGAVFTGMGADGAAGLSAIKAAGGKTIAQDEETSRVFGMPGRAVETGDVDMVLPEERLAEGIVNALDGWSG